MARTRGMETQPVIVTQERIDDVPLLLGMMQRMKIPETLDKHLGRHHLHEGLSNGDLAVGWLAYILPEADHRKSAVQEWAQRIPHTLESFFAASLRPHEFSDDRLGILLANLAAADWDDIESELFYSCFDVYELPRGAFHLDTTTSCGYHAIGPDGIMQLGHSKDHRPDLPQLKIMAAVTQPLAFPTSTAVAPGNTSDDVLYRPTIEKVQALIGRHGLLFCGDNKMASLANRGHIAKTEDYYLTVLPMTGKTPELMAGWIDTALHKAASLSDDEQLTCVWRTTQDDETKLVARGYEFTRELTTKIDDEDVTWTERVQVIQPVSLLESQKELLEKKLQQAEEKLRALTLAGQGRRVWQKEEELRQAIVGISKDKGVEELLEVQWQEVKAEKKRYGKQGRPSAEATATVETQVRYQITMVRRNQEKIKERQERLGWRATVTNAPPKRMSLEGSVLTYREGAGLERPFPQMKDAPLGIKPLFVKRDDQIKGLTKVLLIALRVLTMVEIVVRAGLEEKKEKLPGMHEGQKNKMEGKPTAKRLLSTIARLQITLFEMDYEGTRSWQLIELPNL